MNLINEKLTNVVATVNIDVLTFDGANLGTFTFS